MVMSPLGCLDRIAKTLFRGAKSAKAMGDMDATLGMGGVNQHAFKLEADLWRRPIYEQQQSSIFTVLIRPPLYQ